MKQPKKGDLLSKLWPVFHHFLSKREKASFFTTSFYDADNFFSLSYFSISCFFASFSVPCFCPRLGARIEDHHPSGDGKNESWVQIPAINRFLRRGFCFLKLTVSMHIWKHCTVTLKLCRKNNRYGQLINATETFSLWVILECMFNPKDPCEPKNHYPNLFKQLFLACKQCDRMLKLDVL